MLTQAAGKVKGCPTCKQAAAHNLPSTDPGCSTAVIGMTSTRALRSRMERTTRVFELLARLARLPTSLAPPLLLCVSSLLGMLLAGSGSRRTTHVLKVGSRLGCDRLMLRKKGGGGMARSEAAGFATWWPLWHD